MGVLHPLGPHPHRTATLGVGGFTLRRSGSHVWQLWRFTTLVLHSFTWLMGTRRRWCGENWLTCFRGWWASGRPTCILLRSRL